LKSFTMLSLRFLVAVAVAATCVSAQGGMPHLPTDQWIVEDSPVAKPAVSGFVKGMLDDTKCTDAADQAAWTKHKGDFAADMSTCGHKCMGAGSCVSDCIATTDGYTKDCAGCFGALAQCTKDHCLLQCLGGNTPACAACVIKAGCNTDFSTCSGVKPPSEAPIGSTQAIMPFDVIKCGGNEKLFVTNKLRPSIKFRTCSVPVDPKTGWACNHGTNFVDCESRVAIDEAAELDVDSSVMTVLPVTFTESGAVDMVSQCYMQKPAAGWPATSTTLDQAWWDALQKSC